MALTESPNQFYHDMKCIYVSVSIRHKRRAGQAVQSYLDSLFFFGHSRDRELQKLDDAP